MLHHPRVHMQLHFQSLSFLAQVLGLIIIHLDWKKMLLLLPNTLLISAGWGSFILHYLSQWADNQQFLAHLVLLKRVSSLQELNVGPLEHESNWPTAKPTLTAHHSVYTGCASDTEIYLFKLITFNFVFQVLDLKNPQKRKRSCSNVFFVVNIFDVGSNKTGNVCLQQLLYFWGKCC